MLHRFLYSYTKVYIHLPVFISVLIWITYGIDSLLKGSPLQSSSVKYLWRSELTVMESTDSFPHGKVLQEVQTWKLNKIQWSLQVISLQQFNWRKGRGCCSLEASTGEGKDMHDFLWFSQSNCHYWYISLRAHLFNNFYNKTMHFSFL